MPQWCDFGVPSGGGRGGVNLFFLSFSFRYHVNFNVLYQTMRVFSQIKDRKHIEQTFHSVAGIMPQGWDLGELGGQKL